MINASIVLLYVGMMYEVNLCSMTVSLTLTGHRPSP